MSSEHSSLLQKMAEELDVPAHNTLCSLYNLGSFNIDSAMVDSIPEFPGARFTKIPVYKNNVLNAVLVGVVDQSTKQFNFDVVEVAPTNGGSDVIATFFSTAAGKYLKVGTINKYYDTYENYADPARQRETCVGELYDKCIKACDARRSCRTSCAFWNDWFGGFCNKAMWASALLQCAGWTGHPCANML